MPHILVDKDLPGIRALLAFSPRTAEPLGALAEALLRKSEGLTPAERELIGTYVSHLNQCFYCDTSHGEIARCYLKGDSELVDEIRKGPATAHVPEKFKALLNIAGKVQKGGNYVTAEDVSAAKEAGATDADIHDTVLIAAAFCMFNRYVDGLAANTPADLASYEKRAAQVAEHGYGSHIYAAQQPV